MTHRCLFDETGTCIPCDRRYEAVITQFDRDEAPALLKVLKQLRLSAERTQEYMDDLLEDYAEARMEEFRHGE